MHVHLDAVGGVAGDMFLAAVLDARPEFEAGVREAVRAAGLPEDWRVELRAHQGSALTGRQFDVAGPKTSGHGHHHHTHAPHTFRDIRAAIAASTLTDGVKERAIAIFALLAEAEGAVHGKDPEEVHFHEIADWDSLADIVGAAYVIDALGATSWSVSVLPLGSGRVKTAHGILPVPAPATARLLEGFDLADDGVPGERITPTGAAILRHLGPDRNVPRAGVRLAATGIGFGTKVLDGVPNILRALLFEGDATESKGEAVAGSVGVIEFEIDDQTPEDLAVGLENLRAGADVLDVLQMPAFGKKGRMAVSVRVLCRPEAVRAVATACFAETTTIGLRWHVAQRLELPRNAGERDGVRIKVIDRPGVGLTVKAEMDDIAGVKGGQEARRKARAAAEQGTAAKTNGKIEKTTT